MHGGNGTLIGSAGFVGLAHRPCSSCSNRPHLALVLRRGLYTATEDAQETSLTNRPRSKDQNSPNSVFTLSFPCADTSNVGMWTPLFILSASSSRKIVLLLCAFDNSTKTAVSYCHQFHTVHISLVGKISSVLTADTMPTLYQYF